MAPEYCPSCQSSGLEIIVDTLMLLEDNKAKTAYIFRQYICMYCNFKFWVEP